jgi:hypothetical protein
MTPSQHSRVSKSVLAQPTHAPQFLSERGCGREAPGIVLVVTAFDGGEGLPWPWPIQFRNVEVKSPSSHFGMDESDD